MNLDHSGGETSLDLIPFSTPTGLITVNNDGFYFFSAWNIFIQKLKAMKMSRATTVHDKKWPRAGQLKSTFPWPHTGGCAFNP